ncbi:hypothetical protein HUU39_09995 [candidate division KSB1 bacterium]|nr:hypothetical protein [bacterium]NUM65589.1 hypothetical protein [candidate division KSB1 bacterium]
MKNKANFVLPLTHFWQQAGTITAIALLAGWNAPLGCHRPAGQQPEDSSGDGRPRLLLSETFNEPGPKTFCERTKLLVSPGDNERA